MTRGKRTLALAASMAILALVGGNGALSADPPDPCLACGWCDPPAAAQWYCDSQCEGLEAKYCLGRLWETCGSQPANEGIVCTNILD